MIKTGICLLTYHIKRWKNNYHMLFGVVYLLVISDMLLRPARELAKELGASPSVSAFPLLWNARFFLVLFFFGVLLFYSDVPFQDKLTPFILIRCGKLRLMVSRILYIFFLSILIPSGFFLIQWMLFRPSPDDGWGKLWGTLAQTTVAEQAGCSLRFQYHILWDFTPKEALVFTFLLCILLTLMTGLFLYLCSICGIKHIGCGILSALILLTMIVDWMNATTFNWLSPYSWICLDTTMRQYNGSLPSIGYVFCLLGIINSILLIGIFVRTKCSREALIS